ncbi:hypothetical protein C0Q70_03936 [Pomacea canaliculata]|uniref:Uncharacterized protein n=1 Tax=Pomacea canaliculata TaxID=400727 RepID=A0A2T7PU39_POMCA|nr:hypothetical protein C0Q70_03936 [Pomacea canaliculata]
MSAFANGPETGEMKRMRERQECIELKNRLCGDKRKHAAERKPGERESEASQNERRAERTRRTPPPSRRPPPNYKTPPRRPPHSISSLPRRSTWTQTTTGPARRSRQKQLHRDREGEDEEVKRRCPQMNPDKSVALPATGNDSGQSFCSMLHSSV